MKISFYKGCTSRHLSFEGDGQNLHLSSEQETDEWLKVLPDLKIILHKLVDKMALETGGLNRFYRYFIESNYIDWDHEQINYDQPVKESHEEVVKRVKKHIDEIEKDPRDLVYSLEEMFKEMIETFNVEDEENFDHSCETCGDYNFELKMEL